MSMFDEEDVRLLRKTLQVRERIVDNLISGGLPTDHKDVTAITNLLESIDRSIHGKAKLTIEEQNSKSNEETKEILAELLIKLHKNDANNAGRTIEHNPTRELEADLNFEYREEEFDSKIDTINLEEFTDKMNDK